MIMVIFENGFKIYRINLHTKKKETKKKKKNQKFNLAIKPISEKFWTSFKGKIKSTYWIKGHVKR